MYLCTLNLSIIIILRYSLYSEVNLKLYCTPFLYCPAQPSWLNFTELFRPLRHVSLSLLCFHESNWRVLCSSLQCNVRSCTCEFRYQSEVYQGTEHTFPPSLVPLAAEEHAPNIQTVSIISASDKC